MRVGIIGAGKLGTALGRRAIASGHEVTLAGRPGASQTQLVVEIMVPGARAVEIANWGPVDLAVLAVPFSVALDIDLPLPAHTVLIDPTNHWEPVDGPLPDLHGLTTSEATARRHPQLRWVKSLNQLGYHELEDDALLPDVQPVMGLATDFPEAAAIAAEFIRSLGMAPVWVGSLASGRLLEPGGPVFGHPVSEGQLRQLAKWAA
jgi:predicted dinucleotide-binding enzyme